MNNRFQNGALFFLLLKRINFLFILKIKIGIGTGFDSESSAVTSF
jgi:hypothetical protein